MALLDSLLDSLREFAPHIPAAERAWYEWQSHRLMSARTAEDRERIAAEYQGGRIFALFLINLDNPKGEQVNGNTQRRPRRPRSSAAERQPGPRTEETAP